MRYGRCIRADTAAVMASVFANTKHSVLAYIIHDGTLSAESKIKLEQTAESFWHETLLYMLFLHNLMSQPATKS